jgi:hypothetical protein
MQASGEVAALKRESFSYRDNYLFDSVSINSLESAIAVAFNLIKEGFYEAGA